VNDHHDSSNPRKSVGRCGSGAVVGRHQETGAVLIIPMRCKSWLCDRCRPSKAARAIDMVVRGDPDRFLTLTCNPNQHESPQDALTCMKAAWPRFVRKMRKHFGSFEYSLVWELTKAGWPHIHAAVRSGYLPQSAISKAWREYSGSPVVYITTIKNAIHTAKYLAKYLYKDPANAIRLLGRSNLVQYSKGYIVRDATPNPNLDASLYSWSWSPDTIEELLADYRSIGYLLDPVESRPGCLVMLPPFEGEEIGTWLEPRTFHEPFSTPLQDFSDVDQAVCQEPCLF